MRKIPDAVLPYIGHIGDCGAVGSDDPMDGRCICGLRQTWARYVLSSPACPSCDLSRAWQSCLLCEGEGGAWHCVNLECPA